MIKKIVKSGNLKLLELSKPVKKIDKKILSVVKDLTDTLAVQKDPEGVGLAACQIGIPVRIFVMVKNGKIIPIINPEVLEKEEEKIATKTKEGHEILEGCLSLPNYYTPLKRAGKIKIKYQTPEGKEKIEEFNGFSAQIVQHEIDHLNGIMFLEKLIEQKSKLYKLESGEWQEVELV